MVLVIVIVSEASKARFNFQGAIVVRYLVSRYGSLYEAVQCMDSIGIGRHGFVTCGWGHSYQQFGCCFYLEAPGCHCTYNLLRSSACTQPESPKMVYVGPLGSSCEIKSWDPSSRQQGRFERSSVVLGSTTVSGHQRSSYMYTHTCLRTYVYVYVCIYLYMCVYTYTICACTCRCTCCICVCM